MIEILIEGMTNNNGGKETYIVNIFDVFDKSKFHFSFIAYDEKIAYEDHLIESGASVIHIAPRYKGIAKFRSNLNDVFNSFKYDVLWAHKTTLSSCEIVEIAKRHKVPVRMIHSHSSSNMGGILTMILHSINKWSIRNWANVYLACSTDAAKWFYGKKDCRIVKNGINVERFRFNGATRERIRKELGIENDFVIGHVGRFSAEKNHRKLINVFYEIHKTKPETKLILCGDGEERNQIENQIHNLKLNDSIILLGVIDNVDEVMQALDAFVMPSLFEGLPFALLEAQASGLNCIVSDTVNRDADIIPGNKFISLDSEDSIWANSILSIDSNLDRNNAADVIRNNGFDIINCSKEIQLIIDSGLKDNITNKGAY